MHKSICIHGHFYQPPRFDPWLEDVLPEGSAAPEHDWNARISKECYAPLSVARRLDDKGRIKELVNCYSWMSFNFGPTLLRWMESHAPETYARVLAADRDSIQRLGHGNAMAQVYHHTIMPLATQMDKDLEILWAIQDFQRRYGRTPEGMWLAEAAVDLASLQALVRAGIRFTVLAPRQARAVRRIGEKEFHPVTEDSIDTTRPYLVQLGQGKSITVFFYDSPISRAVAFERLLENGENFWGRLRGSLAGGLRNIATDGESYGHHFPFGEMALAYVIEQVRGGRDGVVLTNYGAYLAAHPATDEVELIENSSWSCVHGVERWKTHCGCSDGGHPDWIQDWRRPLRRSLNYLKYYVDEQYCKRGAALFHNPGLALAEYGLVLAGSESLEDFLIRHCPATLSRAERTDACRLLLMQRLALASFSSCAWFFDDIARIEPLNALTHARRALDLLLASGGPDVEAGFVRILAEAQSNMQEDWDGAAIWTRMITPRRPTLRQLGAHLLQRCSSGQAHEMEWPGLTLRLEPLPGNQEVHVRASWRRTLEEEAGVVSQSADDVSDPRIRAEISFHLSRDHEQQLLQHSVELTRMLLPFMIDFSEGQHKPLELIGMQAAGLVWNWLFQHVEVPADVRAYLHVWLAENKGMRQMLESQVEAKGTAMARELPGSASAVAGLVARTREIGLCVYWWEVQNMIMQLPAHETLLELNALLNISPGAR